MKKNIFAAVLSIASLSAGSVFSVGVDSGWWIWYTRLFFYFR